LVLAGIAQLGIAVSSLLIPGSWGGGKRPRGSNH
jgi:hypothetical protein